MTAGCGAAQGAPAPGPQPAGTAAPKPTRGGWDSPVPAKLLAPCFNHPQEEAQGTDSAQGTGAAGSSCKWCAASAGPAAAWHSSGTCCVAQRGCRIPPLCSCLPLPFPSPCLAPSSAPRSPLGSRCIGKVASERWQGQPCLLTAPGASGSGLPVLTPLPGACSSTRRRHTGQSRWLSPCLSVL